MARTALNPALARIAAACALTPAVAVTHAPAPASAQEPASVLSCTTYTLPIEEVQEGATSEVTCEWVEPGEWVAAMLASTTVATHYDNLNGISPTLTVTGSCGESLSLAGDSWDNQISSTRHRACGTIKHFDGSALNGDSYVTTGGPGVLWGDLDDLHNRSSSIGYA